MKTLKSLIQLFTLGIFSILLWSGCATVGHDYDSSKINKIEVGKTTKEDVRTMFGKPTDEYSTSEGISVYTYSHGVYLGIPFTDSGTKYKSLMIYFNKNGTVKNYTTSSK